MGFKLGGYIVWEKNKAELKKEPEPKGDSKIIEKIESIGIRIGDEVSELSSEGALMRIAYIFKNMKRPSPLILTWDPPNREKSFFQRMKNRNMHVTIGVTRDDGSAHWTLSFSDVEIFKVSGNKKLEKIEATFADFNSHPEL